MITFDPTTNTIHLCNGRISYIVYINAVGYLETLYFGPALARVPDPANVRAFGTFHDASFYYDAEEGAEHAYADGYKNNGAPQEISSHGGTDKRHAPLVVRRPDGSFESDWRYVSHEVLEGVPAYDDALPHARTGDAQTVRFVLKERDTEVYVYYYLTLYNDKDILLKSFAVHNRTDRAVALLRALSMQLDLTSTDYRVVHFRGRWVKERDYCENPLLDGVQEIGSNRGRSSHEENPFVFLKSTHATTTAGEVIGFNLIYSGNFAWRVQTDAWGCPHITYGMGEEDFCWQLGADEVFYTPQAVIAYSNSGTDYMSRQFHDFIRQNLVRQDLDSRDKPILFNSWEGCYFDYDTATVLSYIEDSRKIGAQLFVLDDGWFGARMADDAGLGDWRPNAAKVDLAAVIDKCHSLGLRFGIWFEPEMVNYNSDLYRAHPDYALGGGRYTSCIRHQFHLDMANPAVVDNIYRQMRDFLQQYPVDYIKWDYNRIVAEHYSRAYPAEQQGEIYHRLVLGYYSLLGRLTRDFPDLFVEGCASGGGRFDLGTLYYTPQIWASDESDPAQRMEINYNTSLGYPLSCIGAHVNANPITDYRTKAYVALFGTYGYEMNPNRLSSAEIDQLNEVAQLYHRYHRTVVREGDLYHLLDPNSGNFMAMQCVAKDGATSLVLLINRKKELDRLRYVRLQGLDPDAMYHNNYDDAVLSGEQLMRIGLNLSREWLDEFSCKLILLTRQDA